MGSEWLEKLNITNILLWIILHRVEKCGERGGIYLFNQQKENSINDETKNYIKFVSKFATFKNFLFSLCLKKNIFFPFPPFFYKIYPNQHFYHNDENQEKFLVWYRPCNNHFCKLISHQSTCHRWKIYTFLFLPLSFHSSTMDEVSHSNISSAFQKKKRRRRIILLLSKDSKAPIKLTRINLYIRRDYHPWSSRLCGI